MAHPGTNKSGSTKVRISFFHSFFYTSVHNSKTKQPRIISNTFLKSWLKNLSSEYIYAEQMLLTIEQKIQKHDLEESLLGVLTTLFPTVKPRQWWQTFWQILIFCFKKLTFLPFNFFKDNLEFWKAQLFFEPNPNQWWQPVVLKQEWQTRGPNCNRESAIFWHFGYISSCFCFAAQRPIWVGHLFFFKLFLMFRRSWNFFSYISL